MMKKILLFLFIFLLLSFSTVLIHRIAFADGPCNFNFTDKNGNPRGKTFFTSDKEINYTISVKDPSKYTVRLCQGIACVDIQNSSDPNTKEIVGNINSAFLSIAKKTIEDIKKVTFNLNPIGLSNQYRLEVIDDQLLVDKKICESGTIEIVEAPTFTPSQRAECTLSLHPSDGSTDITSKTPLIIEGVITNPVGININDYVLIWKHIYYRPSVTVTGNGQSVSIDPQGTSNYTFKADILKWKEGTYHAVAQVYIQKPVSIIPVSCPLDFRVPGGIITPTPIPPTPTIPAICHSLGARDEKRCDGDYAGCPWCSPENNPNIKIPNLKPLCDQLSTENDYRGKCNKCKDEGGIWSALGCLPTDFSALIKKKVFPVGLGIAGGVAFLYFLYGAFLILTSTGNAEAIEEAKQIIMSSLAGLLLIIFSIFLLKVIGVDILQLPGFG